MTNDSRTEGGGCGGEGKANSSGSRRSSGDEGASSDIGEGTFWRDVLLIMAVDDTGCEVIPFSSVSNCFEVVGEWCSSEDDCLKRDPIDLKNGFGGFLRSISERCRFGVGEGVSRGEIRDLLRRLSKILGCGASSKSSRLDSLRSAIRISSVLGLLFGSRDKSLFRNL